MYFVNLLQTMNISLYFRIRNLSNIDGSTLPKGLYTFNRTVHRIDIQRWDGSPILPVIATLILAITVFLLVLFRQSPGLVAVTVAGSLTVIGIYLFLSTASAASKFE